MPSGWGRKFDHAFSGDEDTASCSGVNRLMGGFAMSLWAEDNDL